MRTRTTALLAAAAVSVVLTGCSTGEDPAPSPAPTPSASAPATQAAEPAQQLAAAFTDGWEPRAGADETLPPVSVCGQNALPTGATQLHARATSPAGHDTTVAFLDVDNATSTVTELREAFDGCAVEDLGEAERFAWAADSGNTGGFVGQATTMGLDGVVRGGETVAVAPVDGDTVAIVVVVSDDDQGAGTEQIGDWADDILTEVIPVGSGETPGTLPEWTPVEEGPIGEVDDDLPGPQFGTGPEDTPGEW